MALTVLALGLSSCTEECDYTPAQPSAVETNDYYFDAAQPASEVIGLSDTEYTVTVERVNAADEQTIAIYAVADEEIFTIPSTITFAAGETTADIVIGLNENMEPFKNYKFEISLPEDSSKEESILEDSSEADSSAQTPALTEEEGMSFPRKVVLLVAILSAAASLVYLLIPKKK